MILKAFSLLDTKTGQFNTPFFMNHLGMAIRAVSDLGQDKSTIVGRHPSDFALMEVGTFDDTNGMLVASAMVNHGLVVTFLPPPPQQQALFGRELDQVVERASDAELVAAAAAAMNGRA
jgi:hypothetical protein